MCTPSFYFNMYTLDYIKSLHIDLETWNNGPGTLVEEDHYYLADYFDDEQLEPLREHDDELQDFLDGIEALINDNICIGCIKCFTVKDADGNIIGEVEPYYYGYS